MKLSELVKTLSAELATCGDLEVLLENAEFKVSSPLNTNVKRCRACRAADMFQATSTQNLTVKGVDVTVHGLRHWECPECSAQVETPDQIDFNAVLVREA